MDEDNFLALAVHRNSLVEKGCHPRSAQVYTTYRGCAGVNASSTVCMLVILLAAPEAERERSPLHSLTAGTSIRGLGMLCRACWLSYSLLLRHHPLDGSSVRVRAGMLGSARPKTVEGQ